MPVTKSIHRRKQIGTIVQSRGIDQDDPLPLLLKRIFENRNLSDPAQLKFPLANLLPPGQLKDGELAATLLYTAIKQNQKILIVGDYDTDGATASALGLLCLAKMGATTVDYLVPNRFEFGYGLSPEIAEVALTRSPDLVITVDNGISSLVGAAVLKNAGVTVIITDHHLPGPELPDVDAIVNPNQPGCEFPDKTLAGVGVMFYLLLLLRAKLNSLNWFEDRGLATPNLADYLDLVALGTVADVVPLDYNNRILVHQGLKRIRAGRCRPGIVELMNVGKRNYKNIIASDFGFVIAPRLNAAGRLEDISMGIECLLTENQSEAFELAQMLNDINVERRAIEHEMQNQALEIVRKIENQSKNSSLYADEKVLGYCLFDETWHQGITGLVASRIKDKTDLPVIAFADVGDDMISGSARSIPGLHIKDMLEKIATGNSGLVEKFGGHAMAAGLTLKRENLELFKDCFQNELFLHFQNTAHNNGIYTDGGLDQNDLTLENAELLRNAAPWGQGFPAPLFDNVFDVIELKLVGEIHLRLTLKLDGVDQFYEAIAFRAIEPQQPVPEIKRLHGVYQIDVNEFRGQRKLQLIIEHFAVIA